jgi:hypothetical protein
MLFKSALIGGLLAAGHATAIKLRHVNALLQRSDDVEEGLLKEAERIATLTRRQDSNPAAPLSSLMPATGDASRADLAKWEVETKKACMDTLGTLNGQASNPSGMYNVSAPINPWVGVTAADVSMTLSYLGATVQNMAGNFTKRDLSYPPVRRENSDGLLVERQNINGMTELKVLMYVGRINSNLMGSAMNV